VVAWSTTDKSANVTLSGGNLIATFSSATQGSVRGDTSFTGKRYFEALMSVSSSFWSVGWANATASLAAQIGTTVNSVCSRPARADVFFNSVSSAVQNSASLDAPVTARIAIDTTALLFWVALDDGLWNNSATADPASGTGGISLAALGAGPYFPIFGSAASGSQCTARFGAADMWFATPAGFSTLDTNVQAFMASSKFLGSAILAPPKNAMDASKLIGYGLLAPPANAFLCSKLIGYAILCDVKPPMRARTRDTAYLRF
jgi:hypothetical protein